MSHKIDRGWLFTEISCENGRLKDLDVPSQNWQPSGFEMSVIKGFSQVGGGEDEDGKTNIHTLMGSFIVNIDYDEFVKLFMGGVK